MLTSRRAADRAVDQGRPLPRWVKTTVRRWGWSDLSSLVRTIAALGPDVVHLQYQTAAFAMHPAIATLPLWLRAVTRDGARPRFVTTFHDLRPPYLFPKAGPARHIPVALLAATSDAVVLTTPEQRSAPPLRLLDRFRVGLAARLAYIPIGANVEPTVPRRSHFGSAAAADRPLLVYFGFPNHSKGVDTLLAALARVRLHHPSVQLVLLGGGVGDSDPTNRAYADELHALVGALDLTAAVTWTGFLSPTEISRWLQAADLCVLPFRDGATWQRGSLLAALAHACPIITTHPPSRSPALPLSRPPAVPPTPSHPHTLTLSHSGLGPGGEKYPSLRHGENVWLVPPDDPVELARAVDALLTDGERRAALGRAARSTAAYFSWETIAARHLSLYANLIERSETTSS
ncbi:MAG: glycosyltransferase [Chloroflexi bacterium]|nr:glycosyltransferase [Chloroflexota bacterium]